VTHARLPHDPARRRWLGGALALAALGTVPGARAVSLPCKKPAWPDWRAFVARHVQDDGRVIDFATADQRSTSEGQSYALMFALIDNDQPMFERVLGWTRHNLMDDQAYERLPAWLWGRAADGQWRVLDDNNATDADLWIAYALIEAGRLWNRAGYTSAGMRKLQLVREQVVVPVPGLGPMLLPGRQGFRNGDRFTFNPSYVPLQILRRFAGADPKGPWRALLTNSAKMIAGSAPAGFAADWIGWDGKAFGVDPAKGGIGSYDAIRVYLWAGMLDRGEPLRARLLQDLSGPMGMLRSDGRLAEKIDTVRGVGTGNAPPGFAAALLPYLSALNETALLKDQAQRIPAATSAAGVALPYFERTLVLFGQGWLENRYRFAADGRLLPAWRTNPCSAKI
jgi:endoglucanase